MVWITKQVLVVGAMAVVLGISWGSLANATDVIHINRKFDCAALALAASTTGTILSESAPKAGLLHRDGCYVWQQPGVALAITSVWQSDEAVKLYYNPERFHSFLQAMPDFSRKEPFLHPPEPENWDEYYIEPQVYLLDSEQSRSRLGKYMDGYEMWMGYNEGMEFTRPDDAALLTDFAVVYIDSGGPLEFYFRLGDDGKLWLQHLFLWDFFSA